MPCAKNNLTAVLAVFVVRVFVRPHRALHGALGGQDVGATTERSDDEPECNNERQRPSLARVSVVLARCSPTEKLALEIGVAHTLCKSII